MKYTHSFLLSNKQSNICDPYNFISPLVKYVLQDIKEQMYELDQSQILYTIVHGS